jgi:hypothetical protein
MKIDEIAEDLREDYKNLQMVKDVYGCQDIAYFAETMGFIERISKAEAGNERLREALEATNGLLIGYCWCDALSPDCDTGECIQARAALAQTKEGA